MKRQIKNLLRDAEVAASAARHGRRTDRRIIAAGDSLTAASYPHRLSVLLGTKVVNMGVGGETSPQIVRRVRDAISPSAEDALIVWAGNNNYFEPDAVIADVQALAEWWGGPALVLGLVNGDFDGRRRGQKGYEQILYTNRRLAESFGPAFLNIRDILAEACETDPAADVLPAGLRVDEIHLNKRGDQVVAGAVYATLRQLKLAC